MEKKIRNRLDEIFENSGWPNGNLNIDKVKTQTLSLIDQAQQEARINELEWVQAEGGKTNHCDSRELQLRKKLVINRLSELEGGKRASNS